MQSDNSRMSFSHVNLSRLHINRLPNSNFLRHFHGRHSYERKKKSPKRYIRPIGRFLDKHAINNKIRAYIESQKPKEPQPEWTHDSVRVGVIGVKKGMTAIWDEWGVRHPVTVVEVRGG